MLNLSKFSKPTPYEIAAWLLAAVALFFILKLHLLTALLAGLLIHELVHLMAERLRMKHLSQLRAKVLAVALIATLVIVTIALAIFGVSAFFNSEAASLPVVMKKIAIIIESTRPLLPDWAATYLPASAETFKVSAGQWLRDHARELQLLGKEAGVTVAHLLLGVIIGAVISISGGMKHAVQRPFTQALLERVERLAAAFRRVVFAQIRIAALNAFFTWLYLDVALPWYGVDLPLAKTLVAVTFFLGLIPILGNLVSNTITVMVSLSYSLPVAISSLIFLVVIHKLEYFLNARIIGSQIRARAWELLLAMLAMEAAFGLAGLVAAPIYYAYLKDELSARGLV